MRREVRDGWGEVVGTGERPDAAMPASRIFTYLIIARKLIIQICRILY